MKAGIVALGMLALAGAAQGAAMNGVSEQLAVAAGGGKVMVTLKVHNASAASVFVPKAVYEGKQLFGRVFSITEQGSGAPVDYAGPMVKRGPLTRADYVKVAPGATRSNTIDITASYAFPHGTHTYQIGYEGAYLHSLAKLDAPVTQATAPITFTYTAP